MHSGSWRTVIRSSELDLGRRRTPSLKLLPCYSSTESSAGAERHGSDSGDVVAVSDRSAPEGSDDIGPKAKGPSAAAYPINWIVH